MLNVSDTLKGRRILFVGSTGFVGKVALSTLLRNFPEVGRVFALVRPGAGSTSEDRFFTKVISSPVFDPIRADYGDGTEAFLREKVVPIAGDAARPLLNFSEEQFAQFGKLDVIINCAGLVSFTPSLETALRINTLGVCNIRDAARKTGAGVVHISTCFVAGHRDGEVWEDEDVVSYCPRQHELGNTEFHVDAEIEDCQRIIDQVKSRANDRMHISMFLDDARKRLESEGRDPDDERVLRLAIARERKLWVSERLTQLGMERARHWGWPNIYTYTKSLGDQVLASAQDINYALVRPSVVETSIRYPFAGWNEGFTTTAPMCFLIMKGQRSFPASKKANLDIVPVDQVASVIVGAAAAVVAGVNKNVYHAATGDTVPFTTARAVELTSLYARRHWRSRQQGSKVINRLRSRLESIPMSKGRYNRLSAPAFIGVAKSLTRAIDKYVPKWGAPRVQELADEAKEKLDDFVHLANQVDDGFQLFMPFIHDIDCVFRSDNVRELFASMRPEDREKLPWDPENIQWREFWMTNQMPALKKWIFPDLEEDFKKKPRSVYTYKDLVEMFDATTKLHKSRIAMRHLPSPDSDEPIRRFTYRQVREYAEYAAANLRESGIEPGDRVLLVSENCPEWGITYFGILKTGGAVVPVDEKASVEEVINILASSRAKVAVLSERVRERLSELTSRVTQAELGVTVCGFDDLVLREPRTAVAAVSLSRVGEDVASLIFTSGTTGTPKGVMLSHRNFTSLLAKLVAVFNLTSRDKMLSVLPLHHTFEFTAGLLMPLMRGAQITYLSELSPEALGEAFEGEHITAMIGVPALWQMLHRKIYKTVGDKGPWVEEIFAALVRGAKKVREKTGLNVGKVVFWRVHRKIGGRVRLMVSGGSALSPDILNAFRGMGFDLYEGYGLTEAAPVLAAARPGSDVIEGSVGVALPGVEIRIKDPDDSGVGEVIARGPNVMLGYFENTEATAKSVQDGWLYTGDLGKLDDDGHLFIVGRKKDMILAANGENVYPDELEDIYGDSPYIKELSIVGLSDEVSKGELVACLLVPDYEAKDANGEPLARSGVRERAKEHIKATSTKLVHHKRVKVLHLWERDLPRTSTRKVKRPLVIKELHKLQRAVKLTTVDKKNGESRAAGDWLIELIAQVSGRPRISIAPATMLEELGFDSLMYTELGVALEAVGVSVSEEENLQGTGSVADLAKFVGARQKLVKKKRKITIEPKRAEDDLYVPKPIVEIGRRLLDWGQKTAYERLFDAEVTGQSYLPAHGPFIVAANHASHLDMGLVKHALGDWRDHLVALAAKDYFFEDRLKRTYFENFTNLVPMDRHGSLRESLRLAASVLKRGYVLLIFPEGTRSPTGEMGEFKTSIGYLALTNQVDILPMYLRGTYRALPKGASWPQRRDIGAHMGPVLTYEMLLRATEGMGKSESFREVTRLVEQSVRKLGGLPITTAIPPVGSSAGAPSLRAKEHHARRPAKSRQET